MSKIVSAVATGLIIVSTFVTGAVDARGRSVSVQGSGGRGYTATSSAMHGDGYGSSTRSVQTNGGYGMTTTRGHSVSDGTYTGGVTHTTNNGTSFGRATTATANGDGATSYGTTFTGPTGGSSTISGTASHTPR